MFYSLESAIREIFGMEVRISERTRVFGGDANDTFRLTLNDGTGLFMKVNTVMMLSSFEAEAEGLLAIARTGWKSMDHRSGSLLWPPRSGYCHD